MLWKQCKNLGGILTNIWSELVNWGDSFSLIVVVFPSWIYCVHNRQFAHINGMYIQTCMQLNLWHGKYNSSLLYRNLIHWHEMSERAGEDVVGVRRENFSIGKKFACWFVCLFACLLVVRELLMQSNVYFYYHHICLVSLFAWKITAMQLKRCKF